MDRLTDELTLETMHIIIIIPYLYIIMFSRSASPCACARCWKPVTWHSGWPRTSQCSTVASLHNAMVTLSQGQGRRGGAIEAMIDHAAQWTADAITAGKLQNSTQLRTARPCKENRRDDHDLETTAKLCNHEVQEDSRDNCGWVATTMQGHEKGFSGSTNPCSHSDAVLLRGEEDWELLGGVQCTAK